MPPHDAEEEGLLLLGRVSGELGVADLEQERTAAVHPIGHDKARAHPRPKRHKPVRCSEPLETHLDQFNFQSTVFSMVPNPQNLAEARFAKGISW